MGFRQLLERFASTAATGAHEQSGAKQLLFIDTKNSRITIHASKAANLKEVTRQNVAKQTSQGYRLSPTVGTGSLIANTSIKSEPSNKPNLVEMKLPEDLWVTLLHSQRVPFQLNAHSSIALHAGDKLCIPRLTTVLLNNEKVRVLKQSPEVKGTSQHSVTVFSDKLYPPGSSTAKNFARCPGSVPINTEFRVTGTQKFLSFKNEEELRRFVSADLHYTPQGKFIGPPKAA